MAGPLARFLTPSRYPSATLDPNSLQESRVGSRQLPQESVACLTPPRCRLDNAAPKTVSPRLPDPGAGRAKTFDLSLRAVAGAPQLTVRTAAAQLVRMIR